MTLSAEDTGIRCNFVLRAIQLPWSGPVREGIASAHTRYPGAREEILRSECDEVEACRCTRRKETELYDHKGCACLTIAKL